MNEIFVRLGGGGTFAVHQTNRMMKLGIVICGLALCLTAMSCQKESELHQPKKGKNMQAVAREANDYSALGLDITQQSSYLDSNQGLDGLLTTQAVTDLLAAHGVAINSGRIYTKMLDNNSGNYRYTVGLSGQNSTYGLVITPFCEAQKIYKVDLTFMSDVNDPLSYHMVDMGGYDLSGATYIDKLKAQWQSWKGCMVGKWQTLTSDLTGSLACAFAPQSCLAACALSCSGLLPSGAKCAEFEDMTPDEIVDWINQHSGTVIPTYVQEYNNSVKFTIL
ncbi:MAG: hypothetical protein JST27_10205 [Bacteroidetes bacterium]|nr:hypothetical protein [Bacteroidota bacterium]